MKIFVFTLFLYFSFFAACAVYAGSNSITASYPAPSGSYNKVMLTSLQGSVTCSSSNEGMLFYDSGSKTLQMCAKSGNGTDVLIPYPELCFNRFCSWFSSTAPNSPTYPASDDIYCSFNGCPPGYTWASTNHSPIQDRINTYKDNTDPRNPVYYYIESTVCCSANSTVNPSTTP
jgi:hypothetical protein